MYECFLEIAYEAELNTKEDPELLEIAPELCNENPATRMTAVTELRKMIYDRDDCRPHRTDDAYLLRYLRARKFIIPRAYKLLVRYYEFRQQYPHLYTNVDLWSLCKVGSAYEGSMFDRPDVGRLSVFRFVLYGVEVAFGKAEYCSSRFRLNSSSRGSAEYGMTEMSRIGPMRPAKYHSLNYHQREAKAQWPNGSLPAYICAVLDKATPAKLHIFNTPSFKICGYAGTWDPSEYPVDDLLRAGMAITEIGIRQPKMQVMGGIVIVDMDGLTLRHAANLTPTIAHQITCLLGIAVPVRVNSCHIINYSWMLNTFIYIFKRFIPQKTWKNIHFHGSDMKSLHKYIDPECLPLRYGGTCRNHVSIGTWFQKIKKYRDEQFDREMKDLGYIVKE